MPKQAVWVHGTAAIPERQGYFISRVHPGYGSKFRTHGAEWIHFSLATPVIVDGTRADVEKIFVLFDAVGAKILQIHLYDGADRFDNDSLDFAKNPLTGKHGDQIDSSNSWAIAKHAMKYGLGISINVDFGSPVAGKNVPSIAFRSVGADFVT